MKGMESGLLFVKFWGEREAHLYVGGGGGGGGGGVLPTLPKMK